MRRLASILMCLGSIAGALVVAVPAVADETDPSWSVDEQLLADALDCPSTFAHPDREAVLLVHGTGTTGAEQYGWNYHLLLADRGFDFCTVTYPDRGFGDLQESAEYVAYALVEIQERTGRQVDVMGHSQGGLLPRWAIKFWPSARAAVDDAVLVAPPSHGTSVANGTDDFPGPLPAAFFQMAEGSQFITALNAGDETPGDLSWSVLYTEQDGLVQPVDPVPTAALDWNVPSPRVRNIRLQELCPGRVVDHLTIGTTDRLSQELVLDAFTGPGPVDPARLGPSALLCALPDQQVDAAQLAVLVAQLPVSFAGGFPHMHSVDAEPPLKPYAAAVVAPPAPGGDMPADTGADGAAPSPPASSSAAPPRGLPATGESAPIALGATLLVSAIAAARLLGRSRPTGSLAQPPTPPPHRSAPH